MRFYSNNADMINSVRLSGRPRRCSAPEVLENKGLTSLGSAAAASLRRSATTANDRSSTRQRRSSKTEKNQCREEIGSAMKRMDPNDIISMLEMQALTDSNYGYESLQALKNSSPEKSKRTSKRSSKKGLPRRTKSLDADADIDLSFLTFNVENKTRRRRGKKGLPRRTKSMDGTGIPSSVDVEAPKPRRGRRKTLAEQLSPEIDETLLEASWSRMSVDDL